MTSEKAYRELASSLARVDTTVSRYFIVQEAELERYLNKLPAMSPLPEVYRYWPNLRHEDSLPARGDLDPTTMDIRTLPSIVMIDVEDEPQRRFRYRLVGTAVGNIFRADYTGCYLCEMGL